MLVDVEVLVVVVDEVVVDVVVVVTGMEKSAVSVIGPFTVILGFGLLPV